MKKNKRLFSIKTSTNRVVALMLLKWNTETLNYDEYMSWSKNGCDDFEGRVHEWKKFSMFDDVLDEDLDLFEIWENICNQDKQWKVQEISLSIDGLAKILLKQSLHLDDIKEFI